MRKTIWIPSRQFFQFEISIPIHVDMNRSKYSVNESLRGCPPRGSMLANQINGCYTRNPGTLERERWTETCLLSACQSVTKAKSELYWIWMR